MAEDRKCYDADQKILDITIRIKGEEKNFSLVEMIGDDKDAHTLFMSGFWDERSKKLTKAAGQHADLIARCIRTEEGTPLDTTLEKVRKWVQLNISSSTQIALYKDCEELCGLGKDVVEAEKKD